MTRIFWKAIREGSFIEDERLKLEVEFQDREAEIVHVWTPRWAEVATLARRAYETEATNQGSYQETLQEARRQAEEATASRDLERTRTLAFRITALGWAVEAATARKAVGSDVKELSGYVLGLATQFEKALLVGQALRPEEPQLVYCPNCDWHIAHALTCCEDCRSSPRLHVQLLVGQMSCAWPLLMPVILSFEGGAAPPDTGNDIAMSLKRGAKDPYPGRWRNGSFACGLRMTTRQWHRS